MYFAQFCCLLSIIVGRARRVALWISLTGPRTTRCIGLMAIALLVAMSASVRAQDQPPELEPIYKRGFKLANDGRDTRALQHEYLHKWIETRHLDEFADLRLLLVRNAEARAALTV